MCTFSVENMYVRMPVCIKNVCFCVMTIECSIIGELPQPLYPLATLSTHLVHPSTSYLTSIVRKALYVPFVSNHTNLFAARSAMLIRVNVKLLSVL